MEERKANISINKRGGNASAAAVGYKLTIPNAWASEIGISPDSRACVLTYDPEKKEIKINF